MPFLEGFLLGLGMIVFIGPVFIQLITVSIKNGSKPGLLLAIGIFISDIFCVMICRYGNSVFILSKANQVFLSLSGAILLLFLGIKTFLTKKEKLSLSSTQNHWTHLSAFMKGFLVNFVNPFVFLVWLGVTAFSKSKYTIQSQEIFYLSGVLVAILTMDVIKVFLAKHIGRLLKADTHSWIHRISGLCLIGFSIRMLLVTFG